MARVIAPSDEMRLVPIPENQIVLLISRNQAEMIQSVLGRFSCAGEQSEIYSAVNQYLVDTDGTYSTIYHEPVYDVHEVDGVGKTHRSSTLKLVKH